MGNILSYFTKWKIKKWKHVELLKLKIHLLLNIVTCIPIQACHFYKWPDFEEFVHKSKYGSDIARGKAKYCPIIYLKWSIFSSVAGFTLKSPSIIYQGIRTTTVQ